MPVCRECNVSTFDFDYETRTRKCRICGHTKQDTNYEDMDDEKQGND